MEKNLMIYNPVSGKMKEKDSFIGRLVQGLTDGGKLLAIYQTQGKGDAEDFVMRQPIDYDKVICCGGDGTLHEIVNGVAKTGKKSIIAYIPSGSTNDYAKNLGISNENAISCIFNGKITGIDIGEFNGEYFNYVAAFGAFTAISFTTSQKAKNLLGYFAYVLEGIKHLNEIKPKRVRFQTENTGAEDDFLLGMITNAFSVAGIKNMGTLGTKLNDGKMEYLFIKMPNNLIELQMIIVALLNENIDERFMYYGQFEWMEIHSEAMEWTLDGENGGVCESVDIRICPEKVKMIVEMSCAI